jgi:hypothetical protein
MAESSDLTFLLQAVAVVTEEEEEAEAASEAAIEVASEVVIEAVSEAASEAVIEVDSEEAVVVPEVVSVAEDSPQEASQSDCELKEPLRDK